MSREGYFVLLAHGDGDQVEDVDMGRMNLPDDGGLDALRVPVFKLQQLQGHRRVQDDFSAEITEINDLLGHAALLIVINL